MLKIQPTSSYRYHRGNPSIFILLTAMILVILALFFQAIPTQAAPILTAGNEWDTTDPTGWNVVQSLTATQLTNFLTNNNERIVDLEAVLSGGEVYFNAVTVKNAGAYAKSSWWYPNLTEAEVNSKLNEHQARLIDVEAYNLSTTPGFPNVKYSVVMVPNTGSDQKGWLWLSQATAAEISQAATNNNARLIDLDGYVFNSQRRYAAILIGNTGPDFRNWGWLVNVPWSTVEATINNPQSPGRLLDVYYEGGANYTVVVENCPCVGWWVMFGTSFDQLAAQAAQLGARIIDIETYLFLSLPPSTHYMAIMVDNLAAETRRVANILTAVGPLREYGIFLKKVDGMELANLQADFVHEPLSSIKVLPHFYAMRTAQDPRALTLSSPIREYVETGQPGENCYLPTNNPIRYLPLLDVLTAMMVPSNNPAWASMVNHFGKQTIQDFVQNTLQMTRTEIRRVGCSNVYNRWTLRDASKLYESVANGSQIKSAARIDFYNIMTQKWVEVDMLIDEEVPPGMSHNDRNLFKSLVKVPHKDGGWSVPAAGEIQAEASRTRIGLLFVPECSGALQVNRAYFYGVFVTSGQNLNNQIDTASIQAATELMRPVIRNALNQWGNCSPINLGNVGPLGGLISSGDGRYNLNLPPGAVPGPVNFYFTDQVDPNLLLPANLTDLSRFTLTAVDGSGNPVTIFTNPMTITVNYQDSELNAPGVSEDLLTLAYFDERLEQWVVLPSTVDPANNKVSSQVNHFTTFALVANSGLTWIYLPSVKR